jgi:hypothetical protein
MRVEPSQSHDVSRLRRRGKRILSQSGDRPEHAVHERRTRARPGSLGQLDGTVDRGEIGNAIEKEESVGSQPQRLPDRWVDLVQRAACRFAHDVIEEGPASENAENEPVQE